jgi:hypothetical protein
MRQTAAFLLVLSLPLLLSGCTTYGYKTALGENTYPPVNYHKVKLLFEKPDQPYEVIGVVTVEGGPGAPAGDMYRKLIKSAANLGADAVLVTGEGSYGAMGMPGVTTVNGVASTYGNTTYANASAYSTPSYGLDLPETKGFAIKFTP